MPSTRRTASALLAELKRRQVIRVALVYLVVAWGMTEVAATMFPVLHLPDWTVTLVLGLLLIGFPIALVLAWAFDLTPDGVERTPSRADLADETNDPADDHAAAPATARTGTGPGMPAAVHRTTPVRAIVTLPFANLTRDEDGEYLSDGITEELMCALTRVRGLRVVGRTSAFSFKGRALDVREIGAQLGVDAVVEGSVRKAGDRVRIHVQLTDVHGGYELWSKTFDRRMDDVLALEEEVARSLLAVLRPDGGAPERLVRPQTADAEAYTLYLQGRYCWNRRTPETLNTAIVRFRSAIEHDPDFALAHAGLADCYSVLIDHGLAAPADAWPLARAAAERAVELDPEVGETHAALAFSAQVGLDWSGAVRGFQQALETDPDYVPARQRYALMLAWLGRDEEARAQIARARELDPLSLIVATTVGWIEYYARRPEAAAAACRLARSLEPSFVNGHVALGVTLLQLNDAAGAERELQWAADLSGRSPGVLPLLALAHRARGARAEAEQLRRELADAGATRYVSPWHTALAELACDDVPAALDALERAQTERAPQLACLRVEPLLDRLRSESRFTRLIEQAGLSDPARMEVAT